METKFYENGIVEIVDSSILVKETGDIFDIFNLLFADNRSTVILRKENIAEDFFDLSTGVAGEILQKCSTYHVRMAIIGDYSSVKSKALRDFIYESNKAKKIVFVDKVEEALRIFTE
ncbi:MAG: DUF4180 domain-containing protein [Prevotellaceae bacterium]|jgi:hypothetical protein|nr:DUF4180 domain-containing protein [Prevotellaceae bacterium]